jgi:hypothetical protein
MENIKEIRDEVFLNITSFEDSDSELNEDLYYLFELVGGKGKTRNDFFDFVNTLISGSANLEEINRVLTSLETSDNYSLTPQDLSYLIAKKGAGCNAVLDGTIYDKRDLQQGIWGRKGCHWAEKVYNFSLDFFADKQNKRGDIV